MSRYVTKWVAESGVPAATTIILALPRLTLGPSDCARHMYCILHVVSFVSVHISVFLLFSKAARLIFLHASKRRP